MKTTALKTRIEEITDRYFDFINYLARNDPEVRQTILSIRGLPGNATLKIIPSQRQNVVEEIRKKRHVKYDGLVESIKQAVQRQNRYVVVDALVGALKSEVPGFDFDLFLVFPQDHSTVTTQQLLPAAIQEVPSKADPKLGWVLSPQDHDILSKLQILPD